MFKYLLICIAGFVTISFSEKLAVALYYESLCPYCHRFVSNQLYPSYEALKDFISLKFVPFGNAHSSTKYNGIQFDCQHGPKECLGNMIQSCSLYLLNGQNDREMEYIQCQNSDSADNTGRSCADALGISWSNIDKCLTSDLGVRLQLEAERETHAVPVTAVPTVVFNNTFNYELWQEAIVDFPRVICSLINNAANFCRQL